MKFLGYALAWLKFVFFNLWHLPLEIAARSLFAVAVLIAGIGLSFLAFVWTLFCLMRFRRHD